MNNEKWLEKWSAVRERGKARQIIIGALIWAIIGLAMWLTNEVYRRATGLYFGGIAISPYWAIYWAVVGAVIEQVQWSLNERRYRRLTGEKIGSAGRI